MAGNDGRNYRNETQALDQNFPLKVILVFKVVEEDAEDILRFLPSVALISTERACTAVFER